MEIYKDLVDPTIQFISDSTNERFGSEFFHVAAREALHLAESLPGGIGLQAVEKFNVGGKRFTDPRLNIESAGLHFDNPLLVGAGWPKTGTALLALYHLSFAGGVAGTFPPEGQPGNPKPRQKMVAPGVSWNALGFNSPGAKVGAKNMMILHRTGLPFGASVGKNKDTPLAQASEDHAKATRILLPYSRFIELGISSPNTKMLRELMGRGYLTDNIQAVQSVMTEMGIFVPLVIKISPDESDETLDNIMDVAIQEKVNVIAAANTTVNQEIKSSYGPRYAESGGIAGNDPRYQKLTTRTVAYIYNGVKDTDVDVWGVGNVHDTDSAMEKIQAGATMLKSVTGIRTEGWKMASKTNIGLVDRMEKDGAKNISEYIGTDYKKYL